MKTSLKWYVIRRIISAVPVILSVIILSFLLIRLAPGDPAVLMAGEGATPEYVEAVRREFGLDKPLHEQFVIQLMNFLKGNWGISLTYIRPVIDVIFERIPQTLLLVGVSLTIAIIVGIFLGITAARHPGSLRDSMITSFSLAAYSLPAFWLGQILILVFGVYLGVAPVCGMYTIGAEGGNFIVDIVWHLTLPVTTLVIVFLANYSRLTRGGLVETLRMNFILAARAKGVPERDVVFRHALRNALLPVITMAGVQFGLMVGGVVLTETVFAWPGIGRLLIEAVFFRDYPLIMGVFMIASFSVVLANVITDIIYAVIDPRIIYK